MLNHGRNKHKIYEGLSIPHQTMVSLLGRNYMDIILSSDCIAVSGEYVPNKVTRGYKATETFKQAVFHFYEQRPTIPHHTKHNQQARKTKQGYPAIKSKNKQGTKTMNPNRYAMDALISINTGKLNELALCLKQLSDKHLLGIDNDNRTSLYQYVERDLLSHKPAMRKGWLETRLVNARHFEYISTTTLTLPTGMLILQYEESTTGRLYGTGNHLQNTSRIVRQCALYGQYDYDFDNCHYAIFEQLASRQGYDLAHIKEYLSNKRQVRESLSTNLNIPIKDIKQALISLIYGASIRLKEGRSQALIRLLGINKAKRLVRDPLFRGIALDIRKAKKAVIAQYKKARGLVNAANKRLDKSSTTDELAHILQGHEVQMLNVAIKHYGDHITLLQHDGFTSPNGDICTDELSGLIESETGFKMAISKEHLTI